MELSQNVILRISEQKTMELIELYEQEECLWNTCSVHYKNKDRRLLAAKRIAKKLAISGFQHRHVIMKFKNLRNSYCQELKKIANSINSGEGEEVYVPKVLWFSKMDSFLRPHLQRARTVPKCSSVKLEDSIKKEQEEAEDWVVSTDPEYTLFPNTTETRSCSDNEDLADLEPQLSKCGGSETSRNSKRLKTEDDAYPLSQRMPSNEKEDLYDSFGRYVASLLRTLPVEKALNLQPKIVSMIVSTVTEKCDEQSDGNVTS